MNSTRRWLIGWSLAAILLLGTAAVALWPAPAMLFARARTNSFSIPGHSMEPTLHVGDIVRPLRIAGPLHGGDVIVFHGAQTARVDRVIAVAGDLVALRAGQVVLNGTPVPLRVIGTGPAMDGEKTRLQAERLPGEPRVHLVLDMGTMPGDDFGPLRVPPGRLFVLGDNRDESADSRFPVAEGGVGLVPTGAVIGVVDRLLWSRGVHDIGHPIDERRS